MGLLSDVSNGKMDRKTLWAKAAEVLDVSRDPSVEEFLSEVSQGRPNTQGQRVIV